MPTPLRRRKEAAWELLTGDLFAPPFGASVPGGLMTYNDYIALLGGVLSFDGTLTDDATKIKNLGSLGASADATPTDVTIDANGMTFNGTTSLLTVPALTGYNNLETFSWVFDATPAGAGESNIGHLMTTDLGVTRAWRINSASLPLYFFNSATGGGKVDAQSITSNGFLVTAVRQLFVVTFDNAGDRKARISKYTTVGGYAEATYATQDAMVGTISLPAIPLTVGARAAGAFALPAVVKHVAVLSTALTEAQITQLAKLAGL